MQTRHNEEELSNVYIRSETIVKGKKSLRHALLLMRPWAFTLLFLLATAVSLRMETPKLIVCDRQIRDCRTYYDFLHLLGTKHQAMHFKFFLETIQKNDPQSFKIYFLGDSIVLGNAPFKKSVDEKRDDIALTLEEELHKRFPGKKINIYNIASLGEGEYSSFEMLKILVDFKPDFILKNVNFRNYNDFIYTTRQEAHRHLRLGVGALGHRMHLIELQRRLVRE